MGRYCEHEPRLRETRRDFASAWIGHEVSVAIYSLSQARPARAGGAKGEPGRSRVDASFQPAAASRLRHTGTCIRQANRVQAASNVGRASKAQAELSPDCFRSSRASPRFLPSRLRWRPGVRSDGSTCATRHPSQFGCRQSTAPSGISPYLGRLGESPGRRFGARGEPCGSATCPLCQTVKSNLPGSAREPPCQAILRGGRRERSAVTQSNREGLARPAWLTSSPGDES